MAAGRTLPFDVVFTDSCIGGSTVATKLGAKTSGLKALYLADYAINPLGVQSADHIAAVVERWISVAESCAPSLIVACNTASVSVHRQNGRRGTFSSGALVVVTMTELVRRILDAHRHQLTGKRVGVLGTRFTTTEPLYANMMAAVGARAVYACAATRTERVVAALEHRTPEGAAVIADEIGDFVCGLDAVLLGCTCFPLIAPLITRLNPGCLLLDPADAVWAPAQISPRRIRENRLTIGVSGSTVMIPTLKAAALFPTWTVERVVPMSSLFLSIGSIATVSAMK